MIKKRMTACLMAALLMLSSAGAVFADEVPVPETEAGTYENVSEISVTETEDVSAGTEEPAAESVQAAQESGPDAEESVQAEGQSGPDAEESEEETYEAGTASEEETEAGLSVNYVFTADTADGREIFIEFSDENGTYENVVLTAEAGGEEAEYSGDVITCISGFKADADAVPLSVAGLYNGEEFELDLAGIMNGERVEGDLSQEGLAAGILSDEEEYADSVVNCEDLSAEILAGILGEAEEADAETADAQKVIVLDPGHDVNAAGASYTYNGVTYHEEDLTLTLAKYLKSYLEKYENVKVYLTRYEGVVRPLGERVAYASSVGADILVSLHFDACESHLATGVEAFVAYIGDGSYNQANAQAGINLANIILEKLASLGYTNRGYFTRLITDDSAYFYEGQSYGDYYCIVRDGQKYNIPAVIIEHGFMDNPVDFYAHISSDAGIAELAKKDAEGIAQYLSLKKAGIASADELTTGWNTVNGNTYYLYESGEKATGTPVINGKKYCFDSDGVLQTGWQQIGSWTMYFDPLYGGAAATGLYTISGKMYYFNSDGVQLMGWQKVNGSTMYFEPASGGAAVTGTVIIGNGKYWFDYYGAQKTGWMDFMGMKLYFDPVTGCALTGVSVVDGKKYLFDSNGVLYSNAGTPVVDGKKYWTGEDGVLQSGWLYLGSWKMYFDPSTYEAAVGVSVIGGKTYLFNDDGVMQNFAGTPVINGKKYWFSTDDASLKTGWLYLTNWKMYFDPDEYYAYTGIHTINGKVYLFNKDGVMQTYAGTTVIDGKKYWFSTDDASLKTGWLTLGNWKLYFDPETYAAVTGTVTIDGVSYTFDDNGVMQSVASDKIYQTDPTDGVSYYVESTILTDPQIGTDVTEDEFFTAVVYTEGGSESFGVQVGIAMVILNRMAQSDTPNSLKFTIYKSDQFAVARDGALTKALTAFKNDDQSYLQYVQNAKTAEAVARAKSLMNAFWMAGAPRNITELPMPDGKTDFDCLFFMTPAAFARLGLDTDACQAFTRDSTVFFTYWSYGL